MKMNQVNLTHSRLDFFKLIIQQLLSILFWGPFLTSSVWNLDILPLTMLQLEVLSDRYKVWHH